MVPYLRVIINRGICVIETTSVIMNSKIINGIITWQTFGQGPLVARGNANTSWARVVLANIQAQLE